MKRSVLFSLTFFFPMMLFILTGFHALNNSVASAFEAQNQAGHQSGKGSSPSLSPANGSRIWYVATNSPNPGDCSRGDTWERAYGTIQKAVDCASPQDEIWVMQGTYQIYITIDVNKEVNIYGGFQGTEGEEKADRDWETYASTLDCWDTVECFDVTANAVIDGLVISKGKSDNGGGMYIYSASPTISNCSFLNNHADNSGGGVLTESASATISNCTFTGNGATEYGGGINISGGTPTLSGCRFTGNSANDGAAVAAWYGTPTIVNSVFRANTANMNGAGVWNLSSDSIITNCSFYMNTAAQSGGAIFNYSSAPRITNSILWQNSPDEIGNESAQPTVVYCDVMGGYTGSGNLSLDPRFRNPGEGDLHLQSNSPCIETGTVPSTGLPEEDLEGNFREIDGDGDQTAVVDMGAYEYQPYPKNGIWRDDLGVLNFYLQKYQAGSCVIVVTLDGKLYVAFLDGECGQKIAAGNDIGNQGYRSSLKLRNSRQGQLTVDLPSELSKYQVSLLYADMAASDVVQNGIWKSDDAVLSFYLQAYEAGSIVVVATVDGKVYTAFLDSDYSDGISAADDIGGQGYQMSLDLSDSTHGSITVDLPSGQYVKGVSCAYPDQE
ncbi:MAG: choice-of-anchor Q domain-containing protein [Candidatus Odinarchaeota archaeon]